MSSAKASRMHSYRSHLTGARDFSGAKETLLKICTHLGDMEDRVTSAMPQLAGNFVDAPLASSNTGAPVPQPCTFTVKIVNGLADIEIILPQFATAATPQLQQLQTVDNPNALLAAILHNLQSCSDATFSVASGVKDYTPTSQTQVFKHDANTFWRIRSSYDGKNFNSFSAAQRSA